MIDYRLVYFLVIIRVVKIELLTKLKFAEIGFLSNLTEYKYRSKIRLCLSSNNIGNVRYYRRNNWVITFVI